MTMVIVIGPSSYLAGQRFFQECGKTVIERADARPQIGECLGNVTGDPRVFGPEAWRTFHR